MPLTRFKLTAIEDGGISTQKLADGAISTAKLADSSVNSAKIGVDVIAAEDLASNSVTVAELSDNAVTTAKIADANVTTAKIADANVTTAKIADSAVSSPKIGYKEYFSLKLTSSMNGLSDVEETEIKWATNGTAEFDSVSGLGADGTEWWTAPTESEDQYWLFGYQAMFSTIDHTQGTLRDAALGLQQQASGGSWTDLTSTNIRFFDGSSGTTSDGTTATLNQTYLHKIPSGEEHILRIRAYCNTSNADGYDIKYSGAGGSGGAVTFDDQKGTFWWGIRLF